MQPIITYALFQLFAAVKGLESGVYGHLGVAVGGSKGVRSVNRR